MRNRRTPENSFGTEKLYLFNDAGVKAAITYKINGRNFIIANMLYETYAPFFG
ncbi:MAG: hypothetical protein ACRCSQ_01345 [Bacteroidales bacterium]